MGVACGAAEAADASVAPASAAPAAVIASRRVIWAILINSLMDKDEVREPYAQQEAMRCERAGSMPSRRRLAASRRSELDHYLDRFAFVHGSVTVRHPDQVRNTTELTWSQFFDSYWSWNEAAAQPLSADVGRNVVRGLSPPPSTTFGRMEHRSPGRGADVGRTFHWHQRNEIVMKYRPHARNSR